MICAISQQKRNGLQQHSAVVLCGPRGDEMSGTGTEEQTWEEGQRVRQDEEEGPTERRKYKLRWLLGESYEG